MFSTMRVGLSLLVITGALMLPPQRAYACSCEPAPPPAEARDEATAVFAGRVIGIEARGDPIDEARLSFEVSEVWKGPAGLEVQVNSAWQQANCGYRFARGERYLVYAHGTQQALMTTICSRTVMLDRAEADLEVLGEGQAPAADAPGDEAGTIRLSPPFILFALAGLLILLAAMLYYGKQPP